MGNFFQRFFDFFLSFLALLLFSPILFLVFIFSFIMQGSPIFFIHERLGLKGTPFQMIKFRTMKNGPSLSAKDDEKRLTNYGRFLRRTSIDEIPVLFNVLKGDMSLVGPRPMPLKYFKRFNSYQVKRLNIRPGITGLAQIKGRNSLSWEERFDFDIDYISRKSIFLDFKILVKTLFIVIKGEGIKSNDSEIMPEFMGSKEKNLKNSIETHDNN